MLYADRVDNTRIQKYIVAIALVASCLGDVAHGETIQTLSGHQPAASLRARAIRPMAAGHKLNLTISLPLRNRDQLTNLIEQLYDPKGPRHGHYLTPEQFTEAFGPTKTDYEAMTAYAAANGLKIAATHSNRTLLEVEGTVAQVEKAFGITMHWYQHPLDNRLYYAPSANPSIHQSVPVLHISGLDSYSLPHPRYHRSDVAGQASSARPQAGTGPNGSLMGYDFRNAYLPGVTLTGQGQTVGLFQLNGFYPADIAAYTNQASLPGISVQPVLVGGFNGIPTSTENEEVALDIEMAISMAPELSRVLVYEASPLAASSAIGAVLNRMATDNLASQLSCSWGFDIDATVEQIFLQYAAQGQSFFLASGDQGAFAGAVTQPADNPFITVVGGTILTTTATHEWLSETAWSGSGGGISTLFPIPTWQLDVVTAANFASPSMRNSPDVAMVACNVADFADNGQTLPVNGTSIATPLWAGFIALVNQRAAQLGKPPVGFLNPQLYAIGRSATLASSFHDIASGNNHSPSSPNLFPATVGYDLCTGWGTPAGTNLIDALLGQPDEPLQIASPLGFIASGPLGGPFNIGSQTYTLTNTGTVPLSWSVISQSPWLTVSPTAGLLASQDSPAQVKVSLDPTTANFTMGEYSAAVSFVDNTTGVTQDRQFTLQVGNGGFESGTFAGWTFNMQPDVNFCIGVDTSRFTGQILIPGVDDSAFVHTGLRGAFLGQNTTLGSLSHAIPTSLGKSYLLSFWLANPATGVPNEFRTSWNGNLLYDGINLNAFDWTNLQFVVTATGTTANLKFQFRNDQNAFGLDDVTIQPLAAPTLQSVQVANGAISFGWNTTAGATYQVQFATDLSAPVWNNLGDPVKATTSILSTSFATSGVERYFRVIVR